MKKIFIFILLLWVPVSVVTGRVGLAFGDNPIRVGVYQNYPLTFIEENGSVKGFFVDILEYVAENENWTIEYVPQSWSECLVDLEMGRLDLLGVIAYSKQRDDRIDYTYGRFKL